ncbi:MAG: hypothetical protein WBX15_20315, partial [Thermoanaerobaculia bacterium]
MSRGRIVRGPAPPPPFYTPPNLGGDVPTTPTVTHPLVTNRTAHTITKGETQIGGASGPVPIYYGKHTIPISNPLYTFGNPSATNSLWAVMPVGRGEIDAFTSILVNKKDYATFPASRLRIWTYRGAAGQTADPNLAAVDASWAETLDGIAYLVVWLGIISYFWPEFPTIDISIRGRKVLDLRSMLVGYSENTALQDYDWHLDAEGKNLDASRLVTQDWIDAADVCDEVVGGKPRYASHVAVQDATSASDWQKTFGLLMGGYHFYQGNQWRLWLDRPQAVAAIYSDGDLIKDSDSGAREDPTQRPNYVEVWFTDEANALTRDFESVETAAVTAGTEERRPVVYQLPWIRSRSQARRLAIYYLNRLQFDFRLAAGWLATADQPIGARVQQTVTRRGIAAQDFLVWARNRQPNVTANVSLLEYSAACYSDAVVADPGKIASSIPSPSDDPPDVANLAFAPELYVDGDGVARARARVSFDLPNYAWLTGVEIWSAVDGGEARLITTAASSPVLIDPVNNGGNYEITAYLVGRYGKSVGVTINPAAVDVIQTPPAVLGPFVSADGKTAWWTAPYDRIEQFWSAAYWSSSGCSLFTPSAVNDGDPATNAFTWNSSGASYVQIDLGAGNAKEF